MVTATPGLIGKTVQVSFSQLLDLLGANGTLLTLGSPLLLPGSSIQSSRLKKGCLVIVEDVCLGSANIRVYPGGAIGAVPQEELSY